LLLKTKKLGTTIFVAPKTALIEQAFETFEEFKLNPQIIDRKTKFQNTNTIIYCCTLQYLSRNLSIIQEIGINTIIIDEAHLGHTGNMQQHIKEKMIDGRIIALSATPYDFQGKLLQGYDLILNKYGMEFMIKEKYLTPIVPIVPFELDLKGVAVQNGDYISTQLFNRMEDIGATSLIVEACSEIIEKRSKRVIVFAVNIEHAKKLSRAFNANNKNKKTAYLVSSMKKDKQRAILKDFKSGKIHTLVNVEMATAGIDVPEIDVVVMARPTLSQNLYKQMVGRGMRKSKHKKRAYMIDCANLVNELGMPMEKIKQRGEKKKNTYTQRNCAICGSEEKQYIEVIDKTTFKVCPTCNTKTELDIKDTPIHTCESCGFLHEPMSFSDEDYFINKFGIFFMCDFCKNICQLEKFRVKQDEHLFIEPPFEYIIASELVRKLNIFNEKAFKFAAIPYIKKRIKSFKNKLFSSKEVAQKSYELIMKNIDQNLYSLIIDNLSIEELREHFVNSRMRYEEDNLDLENRLERSEYFTNIIKLELYYYEKDGCKLEPIYYEKMSCSEDYNNELRLCDAPKRVAYYQKEFEF